MFSKTLLRGAWCVLLIFLVFPRCPGAEGKVQAASGLKDDPVKLDPVRVTSNPFASWGISVAGRVGVWEKLAGKSPQELYVGVVYVQSPADLAGVQVGDQITAVHQTPMSELPWRELVNQLRRTETGDVVSLALFDEATQESRRVELRIRSTRSWYRSDGGEEVNCWGLRVLAEKPAGVHFDFSPKQQRIKEWKQVPLMQRRKIKGRPNPLEPVRDENGEVKMKPKPEPISITRRIVTITWMGKPLTLIERENRVVEVVEADKAPEKDDVIGRLVHEGATLILRADGSHELKDAPPKPAFAGPVAGEAWNIPLGENVALPLAWIPPGEFTMGSSETEPGRKPDEGPPTRVTLARGFWLGRTLVTIGQWKKVMGLAVREQLVKQIADDTLYALQGKEQPLRAFMGWSRDADPATYLANEGESLPMYFISWNDAMAFARQLNARERAAGRLPVGYEYTLPTEAQWEYACRAGSTDPTYAGPASAAVLDRIAWYDRNSASGYTGPRLGGSRSGPRDVGQKEPNAWGLFDMSGNVWQWCRDWYGPYPGGSVTDPPGPVSGVARVNRGGSFGSGANSMRSACRASNPPAEASAYRGFRLALSSTVSQ